MVFGIFFFFLIIISDSRARRTPTEILPGGVGTNFNTENICLEKKKCRLSFRKKKKTFIKKQWFKNDIFSKNLFFGGGLSHPYYGRKNQGLKAAAWFPKVVYSPQRILFLLIIIINSPSPPIS